MGGGGNGVKAVICGGTWKFMGWTEFEEIKERNNYLGHIDKSQPIRFETIKIQENKAFPLLFLTHFDT
ncbi:MAG: hypothetical protein SWO11_16560 [Thermodesulfobacteriota bacterium]|nr:hypothetical protein [Thermodesulfobacteriota bacterium]